MLLEQLLYPVHPRLTHALKQLPEALVMPREQPALSLQCAVLELPAQKSQCGEAVSKGLVKVSPELGTV